MAYNKSKFVEAAQKLLNQGKVAQAIAEYQQILKHEPRDQVTLMTIGELYIRQGETFQAIDYFERLAQLFVGDGFLTKAIAVYKRIAKLAPEEIRPLEKLADLYVQQGVMSEARPLFLQLAEIHLKNNRQPEAVALLKKLLMAEPDNLRIQIRLADLYQAMGQNQEAVEAYVSAAQRALARGDHAECEKLADKALKLDANNLAAVIVKARVYTSQGNFSQGAEILERVADLDKGGEPAELLLDLYLKNLKWDQASELALRVFESDQKNFGLAQKVVEALLDSAQGERAMAILERTRIPMIDAGEHETVGRLLNGLAERLPGRLEPLEWLVELYGRTSDSFRLPDALAHLGDALVAANKLERAKQVFQQLVDREPESEPAKRKLSDVLRKMGTLGPEDSKAALPPEDHAPAEIVKPPAPKVRPDIEVPAPEVKAKPAVVSSEPGLDDETQRFIAQSLTDVDLFASYGLTQKAIGLLEAILRRAPRHTPTLEKLLDFVLGAGDDRRTAELAAQLEQIHSERGDQRSAERFSELRRRFQRAAGISDEELAAPAAEGQAPSEFSLPEIAAEPAAEEFTLDQTEEPAIVEASEAAAPVEEVHEVDLSSEWASVSAETQAENATPGVGEFELHPVEEQHGPEEFVVPEGTAIESSEELAADSGFHVPLEPSQAAPHPPRQEAVEEVHEEVLELPSTFEQETHAAAAERAPAHNQTVPQAVASESKFPAMGIPEVQPSSAESEFELEQDYELVLEPEALVPAYDQKPPTEPIVAPEPEAVPQNSAPASPTTGFASDQFLSDLAAEIDQLGIGELSPAFSEPAPNDNAAPNKTGAKTEPVSPAEVGPLKEVFEEFRAELGEMGAEDEDLETHYNLGIAFREMGLLEEAISEFQKVAKANARGRSFRYAMQCCTLLGLAFMDKGQPSIAALWYERALNTADIDPESALALRYDLGVAQESAGEFDAALKSFFQVYAVNIDYRDVGERIAALQKPAR
jgi:tetratricopeptide (TPR) repeat protein